jgi:hypothetical protein
MASTCPSKAAPLNSSAPPISPPIAPPPGPHVSEQPPARQQQRETNHFTPRLRPPARHLGSCATAAVALLLCSASLFIVSVAAARQNMIACPVWSTAALSESRQFLAATSLPSQGLAFFAGGSYSLGLWFLFLAFDDAALCVFVILGRVRCVVWKEARFELLLACCCLLMRLSRKWFVQRCGYFRCEQRTLEHCCS